MAAVIKLKRSSTAGVVPTTSDIEAGELALNVKDEKLYSSNGTGVFQVFTGGTKAVSVTTATVGSLASSDAVVTDVQGFANSVIDSAILATKVDITTHNAALANTNAFITSSVSTIDGGTY